VFSCICDDTGFDGDFCEISQSISVSSSSSSSSVFISSEVLIKMSFEELIGDLTIEELAMELPGLLSQTVNGTLPSDFVATVVSGEEGHYVIQIQIMTEGIDASVVSEEIEVHTESKTSEISIETETVTTDELQDNVVQNRAVKQSTDNTTVTIILVVACILVMGALTGLLYYRSVRQRTLIIGKDGVSYQMPV
jgi:hypothetical protein